MLKVISNKILTLNRNRIRIYFEIWAFDGMLPINHECKTEVSVGFFLVFCLIRYSIIYVRCNITYTIYIKLLYPIFFLFSNKLNNKMLKMFK